MTPEEIRQIIREELESFMKIDKFVFEKPIQILDGRNIQVGQTTGTKIGTATTQKIALHGVTPVVQAGAIDSPSADVGSLKTAVDAIRTALTNKGITA